MGCSDGTEGDKHDNIDGDCIVEESPANLLDKADGLWRKCRGVVKIVSVLDFGAIDRLCPGVGSILSAFGVGMLELVQCLVGMETSKFQLA